PLRLPERVPTPHGRCRATRGCDLPPPTDQSSSSGTAASFRPHALHLCSTRCRALQTETKIDRKKQHAVLPYSSSDPILIIDLSSEVERPSHVETRKIPRSASRARLRRVRMYHSDFVLRSFYSRKHFQPNDVYTEK